jgi:hypothetical protein
MKFKSAGNSKTGSISGVSFRSVFLTSSAFLLCVPMLMGSARTDQPKTYVEPPAAPYSAPLPAAQNQPQEQSDVKTFSGKVLSQNGVRYILRDDVNDVWYHLDDQKQAEKFAGKNVLVTGVLDGPTDTIHVREITEAKA